MQQQLSSIEPAPGYYQYLKPQQLRYYRHYQRKGNKLNLKPVKIVQLKISLGELYNIMLEFVQLMFINVGKQIGMSLSKGMVQHGKQFFFLWENSHKTEIGFRQIKINRWFQQIAVIWKEMLQVTIKHSQAASVQKDHKQLTGWMENVLEQSQLSANNQVKSQLLKFMFKMEDISCSSQFNLNCLIKSNLFIPRILGNYQLMEYLSTSRQIPSLAQDKDIIKEKREEFRTRMDHLRELIRYLDHYDLIVHSEREADNMTVQEKQTYCHEPHISRIEQHISFYIKVAQRGCSQKSKESYKEGMQTRVTLIVQQTAITLVIKTVPFWRMFSEHLSTIKNSFEANKQATIKWLLENEVDCYVFDLLRIELQTGVSIFQSTISISEQIEVLYEVDLVKLVLGAVDRQLSLWTIWHQYLQSCNKIWSNSSEQPYSERSFNPVIPQQLKSILLYLNNQMKTLFK